MYFYRCLADRLTAPASRRKVRLLFGPRQTGKTALLRHALPQAHHIDLGAASERRLFEADPARLSRELLALPREKREVVIDEIQKVPSLLDEVQSLYDRDPRRFEFFLTGSSARKLRADSANLLPGRAHVFRLGPVSLDESERESPGVLSALMPSAPASQIETTARRFPAQSLNRHLTFGSLPGVRRESQATARATLLAYVENYLEEEIRREAIVRDLGPFSAFVRLAALESGKPVNLTKLSQEAGIGLSTLRNYYDVLVDTFVGYRIPAYGHPGRKRLLTTPKFLFFDLGVRNAGVDGGLDPAFLTANGGDLLEQWVGMELATRALADTRAARVTFWRTVSGAEVDFVWETAREDVPIEVKWTENPRPEDARHLESFLDLYPRRARRGLIVCRAPRPQQLTERVQAIPWNQL